MPLYTYQCELCGREADVFRSVEDRERPVVCECGGQAPKVPFVRQSVIPDVEPYFDESLTSPGGHGSLVKSKQHRKALMKQFGLSEKGSYVS